MGNELCQRSNGPNGSRELPHPTKKTVRLVFKFYHTKNIHLDCSKVHIIKTISDTKKIA